mmetsp:Transcript_13338/g.21167  ORF Transcript_13338/g.21167 Transcript_13338/m.21167 type:complete len:163 (+) Transcript_13338:817-1305(+)
MASQGASLQNYNNELVKCIEDLKEKREEVNRQILQDEEEKQKIQNDLRILTERCVHLCMCGGHEQLCRERFEWFWLLMHGLVLSYIAQTKPQPRVYLHARCVCRLSRINDSLARKVASRNEYDKTIMETEAAYMKILESSQTLLHVLKRESVSLTKKKQASN